MLIDTYTYVGVSSLSRGHLVLGAIFGIYGMTGSIWISSEALAFGLCFAAIARAGGSALIAFFGGRPAA